MSKKKPILHDRCKILNVLLGLGITVKANIQGEMTELIGIGSDSLGVTLAFHNDQGDTVLFQVAPTALLEFVVSFPFVSEV